MGDTFNDTKEAEMCADYDALQYTFIDAGEGHHMLPGNGIVSANGYTVNNTTYSFDMIGESYYYNPNTKVFITYDSPTMTSIKAGYIKRKNLGGGMFWDLSGDAPETANFPSLITTLHDGLQ
jgi:GH18 family chitinase